MHFVGAAARADDGEDQEENHKQQHCGDEDHRNIWKALCPDPHPLKEPKILGYLEGPDKQDGTGDRKQRQRNNQRK